MRGAYGSLPGCVRCLELIEIYVLGIVSSHHEQIQRTSNHSPFAADEPKVRMVPSSSRPTSVRERRTPSCFPPGTTILCLTLDTTFRRAQELEAAGGPEAVLAKNGQCVETLGRFAAYPSCQPAAFSKDERLLLGFSSFVPLREVGERISFASILATAGSFFLGFFYTSIVCAYVTYVTISVSENNWKPLRHRFDTCIGPQSECRDDP